MTSHACRRLNVPDRLRAGLAIASACLAGSLLGHPALGAEVAVAQDGMPEPVREVLAAKYPGWRVDHAVRLEGPGRPEYRIRLVDETTEIDVVLDSAGHIVDAARPVVAADHPPATDVTQASAATAPKQMKKKLNEPDIYGFAQIFFRDARPTGLDENVDDSNFRVQRVRIGLQGDINDWVSYQVEIDPRSPEVGGILRDAYVDLKKIVPGNKIRIGQQKTTFGYENLVSSSELFAVNRTEVSDNLSRGVTLRDIGIGLRGNIDLNDTWQFEDDFTVVNGAGFNVQDDNTAKKNLWGRVGIRHRTGKDSWQRLGISGAHGDIFDVGDPADPTDDELSNFDRIGVDYEMDHEWFFLSAEYVHGHDELVVEGGESVDDPEKEPQEGWYVNLVGKFGDAMWGPILRYDAFNDVFGRWTIGGYWGKPKDRIRAMFNYEYREKFEDNEGNIGRGDDKVYLWMQVRF